MRRLRIEHRTGYAYDAPANVSYNEARMLPVFDTDQLVLASDLSIRPRLGAPSRCRLPQARRRSMDTPIHSVPG